MIAYFVVMLFSVIINIIGRKKKGNTCLFISLAAISIFLSLGYNWGNDVPSYNETFDYITGGGVSLFDIKHFSDVARRYELGWVFVNLLLQPLGFWGMRAVLFIIENGIVYYIITRHVDRKRYWLAIFIYTTTPTYMILSSSMMRQWLAMCLVMLAYSFLAKRKLIRCLVFLVVSMLFHKTAFVAFLPVVFYFWMPKFTRKSLKFVIPLLLIYCLLPKYLMGGIFQRLLLLQELEIYSDSYMGYEADTSMGITKLVWITLYFFMFVKSARLGYSDRIPIAILSCYILAAPFTLFVSLASRLSYYFTVISIVAFPIFLSKVKMQKWMRLLLLAVIIFYNFYSLYVFFNEPTWTSFLRYETLLTADL